MIENKTKKKEINKNKKKFVGLKCCLHEETNKNALRLVALLTN